MFSWLLIRVIRVIRGFPFVSMPPLPGPKGRVGAACTEKTNFFYAVARPDKVEFLKAPDLGPEK